MATNSAAAALYAERKKRQVEKSLSAGKSQPKRVRCQQERRDIETKVTTAMKRFAGISPEALLKEDKDGLKIIDHVRALKENGAALRQERVMELWAEYETRSSKADLSDQVHRSTLVCIAMLF